MENNPDNISQIPKMQSPFDEIKQSDEKGIAFWNSRQLANVMGYNDYRNFERVIISLSLYASKKETIPVSISSPSPKWYS